MENKNPVNPRGKINRKNFVIYTILYYIIMYTCFYFACPATIRVLQVPHLIQNKCLIEILMTYSPGLEMYKCIAILVIFAYLTFVIYKKRVSDMNYPLISSICLGLWGSLLLLKIHLLPNNITDYVVWLGLFIFLAIYKGKDISGKNLQNEEM